MDFLIRNQLVQDIPRSNLKKLYQPLRLRNYHFPSISVLLYALCISNTL